MNGINRLVESPVTFKAAIWDALDRIVEERKRSWKKAIAEELLHAGLEEVAEGNIVKTGRIKLIRRRIRGGKLQRNIRKSSIKGWTLRGKKLIRIPAAKRVRMRIVAKRSARKRKGKLQNILRKRRMSLRKRKSFGIK